MSAAKGPFAPTSNYADLEIRIITASADQTARVWPATVELLLEVVEALIQRDPPLLTPDERKRFGLE